MIIEYDDDYNESTLQNLETGRYTQTFNNLSHRLSNLRNKKTLAFKNNQLDKRKGRRDPFQLRKLVSKSKVQTLVKNFTHKVDHLRTSRTPIDIQQPFEDTYRLIKWLKQNDGLDLGSYSMITWYTINILQLTVMVFIFSIMFSFPETQTNSTFLILRGVSLLLYVLDMLLNFVVQLSSKGKKVTTIWGIGQIYLKKGFFIDCLSIIAFPIFEGSLTVLTPVSLIIALIKVGNNISLFQQYQYLIVSNQKQHYYGLIKVFLTNFVIGHFLSIFLNLTPGFSPLQNWHVSLGIGQAYWHTKYIWGYYWGTNIMLTVGFGDLSATNQGEALLLIFIEIFSCIMLAYNISNVGALISEIRAGGMLRKKKLKTFHRMSQDNAISTDLVTKVNSFIQQSFQIKEQFEFDQYDELLQEMPENLQSQYRKEANNFLFDNIGFLAHMSKKTLLLLAEAVIRKIAHPEETIKRRGEIPEFMILQAGQIALTCKNKSSRLNGKVFDFITIKGDQKPKIISLGFIKGKLLEYNLKSLGYSVVYRLDREEFAKYIRTISMDFQLFCTMRDRNQSILGENQVYRCDICKKQYHNKFSCSRLHYLPFHSQIIAKQLQQLKISGQSRRFIFRSGKYPSKKSALGKWKSNQKEVFHFLQGFIDPRQFNETMRIRRAYKLYTTRKQECRNAEERINQQQEPTFLDALINTQSLRSMSFEIDAQANNQHSDQNHLLEKIQEMFRKGANEEQMWHQDVDSVHSFRYYFTSYNIEVVSLQYPKRSKDMLESEEDD